MDVVTEKLVALKAFYVGHAVANKPMPKSDALSMVNAAIAQLGLRESSQDRLRLAFYYLVRAEIGRHGGDPLNDRAIAKEICEEIGSSLYTYFMLVETATEGTRKLSGIQVLTMHEAPIERMSSGVASWFRYDKAARALGLNEETFGEKQVAFLERVTLQQLVERHGVSFAS